MRVWGEMGGGVRPKLYIYMYIVYSLSGSISLVYTLVRSRQVVTCTCTCTCAYKLYWLSYCSNQTWFCTSTLQNQSILQDLYPGYECGYFED